MKEYSYLIARQFLVQGLLIDVMLIDRIRVQSSVNTDLERKTRIEQKY